MKNYYYVLVGLFLTLSCSKKDSVDDVIQPVPSPTNKSTLITITKNGKPFGELIRNQNNQIVEAIWYNVVTVYYPLPSDLAEQVYYYAKKYTFEYNPAGKRVKQMYYIIQSKGEEPKFQYAIGLDYDDQGRLKTYMLEKSSPCSTTYKYDIPQQINLIVDCASNFSATMYALEKQIVKEEVFMYKNEPGIQRRYMFTYEYDNTQSGAWSSIWFGSDLYRQAFEMSSSFCKKVRFQDYVGLGDNEKSLYDATYSYAVEKYNTEGYPETFTVSSSSGKDIYMFTYQSK